METSGSVWREVIGWLTISSTVVIVLCLVNIIPFNVTGIPTNLTMVCVGMVMLLMIYFKKTRNVNKQRILEMSELTAIGLGLLTLFLGVASNVIETALWFVCLILTVDCFILMYKIYK